MNRQLPAFVALALEKLRELPFVAGLEGPTERPLREGRQPWEVTVVTPLGRRHAFELQVEEKPLHDVRIAHIRTTLQHRTPPALVVTRHLKRNVAQALRQDGIPHVDAAGNCYLALERDHVAWIEGRMPAPVDGVGRAGRGMGVAGYRVEFTLLAQPALLQEPARTIADVAGVGKTAVTNLFDRLKQQGRLVETGGQRRFVDRDRILQEWLAGYDAVVRPRELVGTFDAPEGNDFERLEERLRADDAWGTVRWGVGGALAAYHWTRHWKGDNVTLHVGDFTADLRRRLKLQPARRGNIHVLRVNAMPEIDPETHLAHPLLVYAELMTENTARAQETAGLVREQFPDLFA